MLSEELSHETKVSVFENGVSMKFWNYRKITLLGTSYVLVH